MARKIWHPAGEHSALPGDASACVHYDRAPETATRIAALSGRDWTNRSNRVLGRHVRPADLAAALTTREVRAAIDQGSLWQALPPGRLAVVLAHDEPALTCERLASASAFDMGHAVALLLRGNRSLDLPWLRALPRAPAEAVRRATLLHAGGFALDEWTLPAIAAMTDEDLNALAALHV